MKQVRENIEVIYQEFPFIHKDGSSVWVEQSVRIAKDKDGNIEWFGVVRDISKRKEIEEALQESEERYRLVMENISDSLYICSHEGRFKYMSPSLTYLTDYSPEEMIGTHFLKYIHKDYHKPILESFMRQMQENIEVIYHEFPFIHKDGSLVWIEQSVRMVKNKDGNIEFFGVIRDISERKKAEKELKKLKQAVVQSPAAVVVTDLNGDIEYVNPKFTELTSYTPEEVRGQNPRILKSGVHSKDFYADLWATITSGRIWRGELYNKKKTGDLYWESASISPICGEGNSITHFVAVKEDITARKLADAEREKLIKELQDALDSIKTLKGMLPICANCKKIRNDTGYWEQVEVYIKDHSDASFSHGICPDCAKKLYPKYYKE